MKAVMMGRKSHQAGDAEIVVAGGMENMSLIPITCTCETEPNLVLRLWLMDCKRMAVDAYDNNAMGVVLTYVLLNIILVEKIKIMLFNLMSVQKQSLGSR
jgi:acetyl-CoA acetyltransferase